MKQIHISEADLDNLDFTSSRLWNDSSLSLIDPENEETLGDNKISIDKAAKNLGLDTDSTLEDVKNELEKQDYREIILSYADGTINTFYLTNSKLDNYPELDKFFK